MNLKRLAIASLAEYIQDNLSVSVDVVREHQDYEARSNVPQVAILPGSFSFSPFQFDEIAQDDDGVIFNAGEVVGTASIRILCSHVAPRAELESDIESLFFRSDASRAQIRTTISGELGGIGFVSPAIFYLDRDSWQEERVFEAARYSEIDCRVSFPILTYEEVPTIEHLILETITNDIEPAEVIEIPEPSED